MLSTFYTSFLLILTTTSWGCVRRPGLRPCEPELWRRILELLLNHLAPNRDPVQCTWDCRAEPGCLEEEEQAAKVYMGNDPKESRKATWPKTSLSWTAADCYRQVTGVGGWFSTWKWRKSKSFLPPLKSHHVNGAYSVAGWWESICRSSLKVHSVL